MSVKSRLLARVNKTNNGCWIWCGCLSKDGYGSISVNCKPKLVHRVAYELWREPIPPGLQIDHLCRIRSCVNPKHLEVVTQQENFKRGNKGSAYGRIQKLKTHCPRGHPYNNFNTYKYKNQRFCIECHNARRRKGLRKPYLKTYERLKTFNQ